MSRIRIVSWKNPIGRTTIEFFLDRHERIMRRKRYE